MDESSIIAAVLNGNVNAFSLLVTAYQDMAFSIAFRVLRNHEDTRDAVQESFLNAYKGLSSFKKQSKFSTWFFRIVYRTAMMKCRSKSNRFFAESHDTDDTPGDFIQEHNYQKILEIADIKKVTQDILDLIPSDESVLLTLYYLESCSISEIAEITGLNESNIKVKLFRARKHFHEQLKLHLRQETAYLL